MFIQRNKLGRFVKGHKFRIGLKHTEKTKKKISLAKSGKKLGKRITPWLIGNKHGFKKGKSPWNKGKKLSKEHVEKLRLAQLKNPVRYWLRKNRSEETKIKISKANKGCKPWNYIDGRSKLLSPARYGDDWEEIRYLVYLRDKFTCQSCGINKIRLDIHHKIPYLYSGDNSLDNLITLCRKCHMKEEMRLKKEYKKVQIRGMRL